MTLEIGLVLGILAVAIVLFVTEWLRMDLVALLVLGALAVTRLVTPAEALSGFSNPAVITVWAMFMLSAGLTATGIADVIGKRVLRLAGTNEVRMIMVIMLTAGALSAFMNNIGVAALMLPVVMDIARQTGRSPSRLLMPLAYGSLLGGLTTLIGTPPNLLVSEALAESGHRPFGLFDYTPIGTLVMVVGVVFVALVGRHLLPKRDVARETQRDARDLAKEYALDERSAVMRLPNGSVLVGKSLREVRLGPIVGLNVFAIVRAGRTTPAPDPDTVLEAGDQLLIEGKLDRFIELRGWRQLLVDEHTAGRQSLVSGEIELAECVLSQESTLPGQTLRQADFRRRFAGMIVLAVRRDSSVLHANLAEAVLHQEDRLLVQGHRSQLEQLAESGEVELLDSSSEESLVEAYQLDHRLSTVRLPPGSPLDGKSLLESRIGELFSLGVLALERGEKTIFLPGAEEELASGDRLLVRGRRDSLAILQGLQELEVESEVPKGLVDFESERSLLTEAMLAPRSTLPGKTLRDIDFRQRFGFRVLAILRGGRSYRSNLRDMKLQFGDALLLLGNPDRRAQLARDPEFIMLTQEEQPVARLSKAPLAALILLAVMATVVAGWTPIAIAGIVGASLMVLSRCLTMEEAYRAVEWRAIFLISGMLPLGAAMQSTGAAEYLAQTLLTALGPMGPWGVLVGLYVITAMATAIIPTAALVVLMAPIALDACADLGMSPHAAMMAVAIAASASFTSPISHPANILVMGPGGYRFVDYFKLGLPLTLVVMVVALLVLPVFWPL